MHNLLFFTVREMRDLKWLIGDEEDGKIIVSVHEEMSVCTEVNNLEVVISELYEMVEFFMSFV